MDSIGERIRGHRKRLGLTITELAHKVDVSPSTVSRWERDEDYPTAEHAPALAPVLGVTYADLHGPAQAPEVGPPPRFADAAPGGYRGGDLHDRAMGVREAREVPAREGFRATRMGRVMKTAVILFCAWVLWQVGGRSDYAALEGFGTEGACKARAI